MLRLIGILLVPLLLLHPCPAAAADLLREQRLENQIVDYIMDGEPVHLDADGHRFLSIFMESEQQPAKGAVILMHGRGLHPDWPKVIQPLRTGLPASGWHTLSIQMPVLGNQASFYDYLEILPEAFPRIDAAIHYLHQQGVERIVLLAHSCSVHMGIAWLEQKPRREIAAFVGIGMGSTDKGQPMRKPFPLQNFNLPVLDIRGEHDYPAVHARAPDRWARMQRAGNVRSKQLMVPGADHYFTDKGDVLLEQVAGWLNRLD